jgi:serine protease AprX
MKPGTSGSGTRANALWGRGGRYGTRRRGSAVAGRIGLLVVVTALAVPAAGVAASNGNGGPSLGGLGQPQSGGQGQGGGQQQGDHQDGSGNRDGMTQVAGNAGGGFVTPGLLAQAQTNPNATFKVIVQGKKGDRSEDVGNDVQGSNGQQRKSFRSIAAVAATLSGKDIVKLLKKSHVLAVTWDRPIHTTAYENAQMWPQSSDVSPLWDILDPLTGTILSAAPQAPAVAIVDSGVDPTKVAEFGSRIAASVNLCSLCFDGSPLDQEGHGTMVAGVLANQNPSYPGAAPNAPLVSVKTADADGQSMTSDVIAAADWILANKDQYNIKVANFSMAGASPTSFRFDPLDQAVEKLWFSGITVVAAAGNFGTGTGAVDMSMAPGNDPFVITVGALDQQQSVDPSDDIVPAWSAYGFTADGFSKPDVSAPGRYMIMPVPAGSTIPATVPDRIVEPGYMWMSGTSFAAPVVAGAAAQILARHPDWGPDQVKGALMLTAAYLPYVDWQAAGTGEVDAALAASLVDTPPNPNENLVAYVAPDPSTGQPVFDQAAWASAAWSSAAWSSAAWSSAAWASAAWSSAAWASAAWSSAIFTASTTTLMSSLATYSEATFAP